MPSALPVRQPNPHIKQAFRGTFRNRTNKLNRFSYLFSNRLPVKSFLRKAFQIAGGTEIELAPVHVQRFAESRANQDGRSGVLSFIQIGKFNTPALTNGSRSTTFWLLVEQIQLVGF